MDLTAYPAMCRTITEAMARAIWTITYTITARMIRPAMARTMEHAMGSSVVLAMAWTMRYAVRLAMTPAPGYIIPSAILPITTQTTNSTILPSPVARKHAARGGAGSATMGPKWSYSVRTTLVTPDA